MTDAAHHAKGGKIIVLADPDPDAFDRDRWTPENVSATRGSFLAFGDGRRKCIGENFARSELQIVLAAILRTWQSFELTSPAPRPQARGHGQADRLAVEFRRKAAPPRQTSDSPSQVGLVPDAGSGTRPTPSGS